MSVHTIYIEDECVNRIKENDLNLSAICQHAVWAIMKKIDEGTLSLEELNNYKKRSGRKPDERYDLFCQQFIASGKNIITIGEIADEYKVSIPTATKWAANFSTNNPNFNFALSPARLYKKVSA